MKIEEEAGHDYLGLLLHLALTGAFVLLYWTIPYNAVQQGSQQNLIRV